MSQEHVEPVRQPLVAPGRSRRSLEERLAARFPAALAWLAGRVWRLPPRSRLRRAVIQRSMRLGIEAYSRRDYRALINLYHSDIEYITPPQLVALGFDSVYRGREARIDVQERWLAEWGDFLFKPDELVDVGDDRLLVLGRMEGRGLGSGVELENDWGLLLTISGGRVIREQVFLDHAGALDAAGLS